MNVVEFVKNYNLIKPSFEEIEDPTISSDVLFSIAQGFDLRITSMDIFDDPIIDLIENTNICDTTLSVFQFYKCSNSNSMAKIGSIDEMGYLFFNRKFKCIKYEELYSSKNGDIEYIDQNEFLMFFLKYLELDFNRVFRNSVKDFRFVPDIELNVGVVKRNHLFKDLLFSIGLDIDDL